MEKPAETWAIVKNILQDLICFPVISYSGGFHGKEQSAVETSANHRLALSSQLPGEGQAGGITISACTLPLQNGDHGQEQGQQHAHTQGPREAAPESFPFSAPPGRFLLTPPPERDPNGDVLSFDLAEVV
jgi:hypothetical protein